MKITKLNKSELLELTGGILELQIDTDINNNNKIAECRCSFNNNNVINNNNYVEGCLCACK